MPTDRPSKEGRFVRASAGLTSFANAEALNDADTIGGRHVIALAEVAGSDV